MSRYSIQKYIDKKWKDISKDIPTVKAYNLGLAVGYFQAYKNEKIAEALATKLETWQKLKDQYGDDKEAILEAFVATGGKEEYYKWLDTVGPREISDTRLKQDWLVQNDYEAGRIVRQMASWGKDLRSGIMTTSESRERLSGIVSRAKNLRR